MKLKNKSLWLTISCLTMAVLVLQSFTQQDETVDFKAIRLAYEQPSDKWPSPTIDSNIRYIELGILPKTPISRTDSTWMSMIQLGRVLFHDPRLSSSNQISCGSCHNSDLNWTDGRRFAVGHDHNNTTRHTPTVENAWFYKHLFWDGRANSLEEQVPNSIQNPLEMNQDTNKLAPKLSKIKGYGPLFESAFGDKKITLERISKAIATYERTITSRKTKFDEFVAGKYQSMTDEQVWGLHLFRTKARCANCHHGPLFTDDDFHNEGLTYYGRDKYEDLGRYAVTKKKEDVGKFKTPSLRNVMNTRPWFHNGLFPSIDGVLNMYNAGMPRPKLKPGQENDTLYPTISEHLKPLGLSLEEKNAIIAFLHSITSLPIREDQPELPK